MITAHTPPHDVFLNVRKAYRLLHDYQCMVRDGIGYIGSQFDIGYNGWWPRLPGSAGLDRTKLKISPWDLLEMVFNEFHFVKEIGDNAWLSLSLIVISDSGFIDGDEKVNDKENLSAFAPADVSSTKFAFILRKTHWDHLHFMDDKVQMRNFIRAGGSLPHELIKREFVGKCYDMTCLTNEAEANKVVSDIIASANERAWPLELKNSSRGRSIPELHSPNQPSGIQQ